MNIRGNSLIELLFIIAIVSVFAAITLPKFTTTDEMELDHAALQLAADLRWLQQTSINIPRGHEKFPNVSPELIPKMRIRQGQDGGCRILLGTEVIKKLLFSKGVMINANYTEISFNNDGYINRPITITLSQHNRYRQVIIDRVGRIRIQ